MVGVETAHVEKKDEEEEERAAVDSALVMMPASSESSEILLISHSVRSRDFYVYGQARCIYVVV